ncbi:MAG: putative aminohydrolase SsnA [Phototrophicaceae bacterium]
MLLVHNATILTWDDKPEILPNYAVLMDDGVIRAIGGSLDLIQQFPDVERLDAKDQLMLPGNICAHTHFYGTFARGMAIPGEPAKDFPEVLAKLWWPLDKALDETSVRLSAELMMVDAIKHGTTTLIDHHASPNFIDGSLDVIADVVERAGLRGVLCYEVTDRDGKARAQAGIRENLRFIAAPRARVRGTFGLHASLTLDDDTLEACASQLPSGAGFHIHIAEHEADPQNSLQRSGKRTVHRLEQFGILGERTLAAHCIHIDASERERLAASGTWVSHQPRSNMNNGVGAMDFSEMLAQGVKLCLGTDGFSHNMFAEWKAAYLLHKLANRDPREANGADVIQVATANNARLAETFFSGERLGEISVGAAADVILLDYRPFTPLTRGNAAWHLLFGYEASMITATIANGKVLMKDRVLVGIDESRIVAEALAYAPTVWERYAANVSGIA